MSSPLPAPADLWRAIEAYLAVALPRSSNTCRPCVSARKCVNPVRGVSTISDEFTRWRASRT